MKGKKTGRNARKGTSIGTQLMLIFAAMILISTFANLLNFSAMKTMNEATQDMAVDKIGDLNRVNNVQCAMEAIQKDFYRYIATGEKESSHEEAANDYVTDKEKLLAYVEELVEATPEDEKEKIVQFESTINDMLEIMDQTMVYKDNEEASKVLVQVNRVKTTIASLNTSIQEMKDQSAAETTASQENISGLYKKMAAASILMIVVTLVSGIGGMLFASVGIVKPMKKASGDLSGIIEGIQNGQGDLTTHIVCKKKDEVGQMVSGMNDFMDVLREIINKIKNGSYELEAAAAQVNSGVRAAGDKITDTSATMQELAASMEETSAAMTNISDNIERIKERITVMAEKTNEGLSYVDNIRKRADDMQSNAMLSQNNAKDMVYQISTELSSAIEQSKRVEKINELTDEILSISSQTNLLALNASIEAARAGEAGKGFAVVADEIRKLADDSRNTANGIQEISGMVTGSVENLSENAEKMLRFVNEEVLKDYDGMVETGQTYHEDANQMNHMMKDLQEVAGVLKKAAEEITEAANGVMNAVNQSAEGVENAAEYTADVAGHMSVINTSVEKNLVIADSLKGEVKGFKCE